MLSTGLLVAITHWLDIFIRRFFQFSQFERSALPNGPKVSAMKTAADGDTRTSSPAATGVQRERR